jgi:hypothetical protein
MARSEDRCITLKWDRWLISPRPRRAGFSEGEWPPYHPYPIPRLPKRINFIPSRVDLFRVWVVRLVGEIRNGIPSLTLRRDGVDCLPLDGFRADPDHPLPTDVAVAEGNKWITAPTRRASCDSVRSKLDVAMEERGFV